MRAHPVPDEPVQRLSRAQRQLKAVSWRMRLYIRGLLGASSVVALAFFADIALSSILFWISWAYPLLTRRALAAWHKFIHNQRGSVGAEAESDSGGSQGAGIRENIKEWAEGLRHQQTGVWEQLGRLFEETISEMMKGDAESIPDEIKTILEASVYPLETALAYYEEDILRTRERTVWTHLVRGRFMLASGVMSLLTGAGHFDARRRSASPGEGGSGEKNPVRPASGGARPRLNPRSGRASSPVRSDSDFEEIFSHLRWMRDAHSDDIPLKILSGRDQDALHYKVRKNWWVEVLADMENILRKELSWMQGLSKTVEDQESYF